MASKPSKWVPLMIPLSLEKRKNHTEQDQVNWKVVPIWWYSYWPGTAKSSRHCELVHCQGEAWFILPQLISNTLSKEYTTGSLNRLANWSFGIVARTYGRQCPSHQQTWSMWLWFNCLAFFELSNIEDFQWLLWHLVYGSYSKINVSSPVMTKQVWFSLKMLDDVLIYLHVMLLLIIFQPSWHHFADFLQAQIFLGNIPNIVTLHSSISPISKGFNCISTEG